MDEVPSFDLSGRVALVTGAGRGLGRAIALALASAGADVALGLRDAAADGGLAEAIAGMGRRAVRLQMDVTDLGAGAGGDRPGGGGARAGSTSWSTTPAAASTRWRSTSPRRTSTRWWR